MYSFRKIAKKAIVPIRQITRYVQSRMADRTSHLRFCKGIIHVGANAGQERAHYARLGLNVLWVEPIPHVFAALESNLRGYPKQQALEALVTDQDGINVELQISSNGGKSSSILALAEHKEVWPDIDFKSALSLFGVTLPSLIKRNNIDASKYDALLLDTQGAELLILRGASAMLSQFKYIQAEAANFEAYENCPRVPDIVAFVEGHGFKVDPASMAGWDGDKRGHWDLVFERHSG
jgi:FkbM family methyltransferase